MIKFLFLGRRAPGRTRVDAQTHLREVHGRMVVCPPADAGAMPSYYAQNHVIDGAYPAGGGSHAIERDLVTQLEFDTIDMMQASTATPYYRNELRPDEPRFVDDASVVRLNVVPRRILDAGHTRHKLFLLVSRSPTIGAAAWEGACRTMADAIGAWGGIAALIGNEVLAPPAGTRFVDQVFEAWFEDRASALAAAPRATALFDAGTIDRSRSLVIIAEEFTEERLRSLWSTDHPDGKTEHAK